MSIEVMQTLAALGVSIIAICGAVLGVLWTVIRPRIDRVIREALTQEREDWRKELTATEKRRHYDEGACRAEIDRRFKAIEDKYQKTADATQKAIEHLGQRIDDLFSRLSK